MILGNSRRRPDEGEADFLILDPARGFICLEVKGGQEIGRDTEGWYSVPHGRADVSGSRTLGCKRRMLPTS